MISITTKQQKMCFPFFYFIENGVKTIPGMLKTVVKLCKCNQLPAASCHMPYAVPALRAFKQPFSCGWYEFVLIISVRDFT